MQLSKLAVPLLALASTVAAQPLECEIEFIHPHSGLPTRLSLEVESPRPGAELRRFGPHCAVSLEGRASAAGDVAPFDIYLVLDTSGSANYSAGIDVNGDGIVSAGPPDSVLDAEIAAARAFLQALDLSVHRVALTVFNLHASLRVGLTHDVTRLLTSLDALSGWTGSHPTNFGAGLAVTLGHHQAAADPDHEPVMLFLSDGWPNQSWIDPPGPLPPCSQPPADCNALAWAAELANHGLTIHTYALGAGSSLAVLQGMSRATGGRSRSLAVAGDIIEVLPRASLLGIDEIDVRNETTTESRTVELSLLGEFSEPMSMAEGPNLLTFTAILPGAVPWPLTCSLEFDVDCLEVGCPDDLQLECEDGGADAAGLIAWADDPDVEIAHDAVVGASGEDASGRYPLGPTLVTWTFSDAAAGTSSCTILVEVVDGAPPELGPLVPILDASCAGVPTAAAPTVSDACDPLPGLALTETRIEGDCPDRHELLRSWTASDATGNTSTIDQLVRVDDLSGPELSARPIGSASPCDAVPPPPVVSAIDDCDPDPDLDFRETRIAGPCPFTYALERSWSASDRCGNVSRHVQRIDVSDEQAPALVGVPADTVASCTNVPLAPEVTAEDACDPAPRVRFEEDRLPGPCIGSYLLERRWTALDACGNENSRGQSVEIVDDEAPTLTGNPDDRFCAWPPRHRHVRLEAAELTPTAEDGCSGLATWHFVGCNSNQADDGLGDGATTEDCVVADDGRSIRLRSERLGGGPGRRAGRTYEVLAVAVDPCGNRSAPSIVASVHVPHDRGGRGASCAGSRSLH